MCLPRISNICATRSASDASAKARHVHLQIALIQLVTQLHNGRVVGAQQRRSRERRAGGVRTGHDGAVRLRKPPPQHVLARVRSNAVRTCSALVSGRNPSLCKSSALWGV